LDFGDKQGKIRKKKKYKKSFIERLIFEENAHEKSDLFMVYLED